MITLTGLLALLQNNSYVLIFILMFFEGPVVTAAAAFAASLGYLNVFAILILSFLGSEIPDTILFFIGRLGRRKYVERIINRFGISAAHIKSTERRIEKHAEKALVIVKLTPFLPVPGIVLAGFMKVPIKRFYFVATIFNLASAVISTIIGYYLGIAAGTIFSYFKIGDYILLAAIPLIIFTYWIYKKFYTTMRKRV